MFTKLKNLWHRLFGLYLISGFTTIAFFGETFAQGVGGGSGVPFQNPGATADINISGVGADQGDTIIAIVKRFINYALGLLALIALIMLLWGGYKMVASGGKEDAYKEGLGILKNAAIGLAFIAVSWFLVTFIFYVIGLISA